MNHIKAEAGLRNFFIEFKGNKVPWEPAALKEFIAATAYIIANRPENLELETQETPAPTQTKTKDEVNA